MRSEGGGREAGAAQENGAAAEGEREGGGVAVEVGGGDALGERGEGGGAVAVGGEREDVFAVGAAEEEEPRCLAFLIHDYKPKLCHSERSVAK